MPKKKIIAPKPIPADDWQNARTMLAAVKLHGRLFLLGQVLLGWQLSNLKKSLGLAGSGSHKKQKCQNGTFETTWENLLETELGISKRTAYRFESAFQAARLRMKRLGGHTKALVLLDQDPANLAEAQHKTLEKLVEKITDGETQKDLLEELKLVKLPPGSELEGGKKTTKEKKKKPTMAQLAFALFSDPLQKIINLRTHSSYKKALHALDVHSDDDDQPDLTKLEQQLQATLSEVTAAKTKKLQSNKK